MFNFESKTYSLRPCTDDDLAIIIDIERKSIKNPWTKQNFIEELQKPFSNFLILSDDEDDQKIIAYTVFWKLFEEIHLLNIVVDPEYRGLGVGNKILNKIIQIGIQSTVKRIFLEVRKSNLAAIKLYENRNFHVDHEIKSFYDDGEDAYFMQLYLNKNA